MNTRYAMRYKEQHLGGASEKMLMRSRLMSSGTQDVCFKKADSAVPCCSLLSFPVLIWNVNVMSGVQVATSRPHGYLEDGSHTLSMAEQRVEGA